MNMEEFINVCLMFTMLSENPDLEISPVFFIRYY